MDPNNLSIAQMRELRGLISLDRIADSVRPGNGPSPTDMLCAVACTFLAMLLDHEIAQRSGS